MEPTTAIRTIVLSDVEDEEDNNIRPEHEEQELAPPSIEPPVVRTIVASGRGTHIKFGHQGLEEFTVSESCRYRFDRRDGTLTFSEAPLRSGDYRSSRQQQRLSQTRIRTQEPGMSTLRIRHQRCVRKISVTAGAVVEFGRTFDAQSERFWGALPEGGVQETLTLEASHKGTIIGFAAPSWLKIVAHVRNDGTRIRARPSCVFSDVEASAELGGTIDQFNASRTLSVTQVDGDGNFHALGVTPEATVETSFGPRAAQVHDLEEPHFRLVDTHGRPLSAAPSLADPSPQVTLLFNAEELALLEESPFETHPHGGGGRVLIDLTFDDERPRVVQGGGSILIAGSMLAQQVLRNTLAAAGALPSEDQALQAGIRESNAVMQQLEDARAAREQAKRKRKADNGGVVIQRKGDAAETVDPKKARGACSICHDPVEKISVFIPCGHAIGCDGCSREVYIKHKGKCSVCRADIKQVVPVYDALAPLPKEANAV